MQNHSQAGGGVTKHQGGGRHYRGSCEVLLVTAPGWGDSSHP